MVLTPSPTPQLDEGQAGLGAGTQEGRTHTGQRGHRMAVLIIGGLVAFPFLRSGDQGKLLTRTKSEDSMSISKGENAAIDDEDMNDSIEAAAEETEAEDN